jgi:hypothetical protein
MPAPSFRHWPERPRRDDLAAALAAVGVIWASVGVYPFSDEEESLVQQLRTALKGHEIVDWSEPYFLEEANVGHVSGNHLASAWRAVTQEYQGFRLKLKTRPSRALWYMRLLSSPKLRITAVFLNLNSTLTYIDWNWPIRVGIMSGTRSNRMELALRQWIQKKKSWLEPLVELVDIASQEPAVDFLFFPDGRSAFKTLRKSLTSVRANCLFLLGTTPNEWKQLAGAIQESAALTQANGVAITTFEAGNPGPWFTELVRELSHNIPLDVALQTVSNRFRKKELLASSTALIDGTRLSVVAARLSRRLDEAAPSELEVDERMSQHIDLLPGRHRSNDVARKLMQNLERFQYLSEADEATTVSRISRDAHLDEVFVESTDDIAGPRALQHYLYSEEERYYHPNFHWRRARPDAPFGAGFSYTLVLRVGSSEDGWISLDRPFPERELPPSDRGHLLTIVFSEPFSVPQPMIATMFLPPKGPSSICEFRFKPNAKRKVFEGRVIVLHKNRVLQSALLRASVLDLRTQTGRKYWMDAVTRRFATQADKERQGEPAEGPENATLVVEAAVRPFTSLNDRRDYAATLLLNKSIDGQSRVTRVAGYRASLISLKGIEKAIEAIKSTWDGCDWEGLKYDRLDAKETLDLLRSLAVHGRLLYDALVDDQQLAERLKTEPRIQVIAARVDAHLPIEFCYSRTPPKSTARICPNAAKALREGRCDKCEVRTSSEDAFVCPLAFWGLSKVIEWHRFDVRDQQAIGNADFALQNEPTPRNPKLTPLEKLLMGSSAKIPIGEITTLQNSIHLVNNAKPRRATTWEQWTDAIEKYGPATLLLMVHTALLQNLPSMEIGQRLLDPPYVDVKHVLKTGGSPPLVLLLGCGTGVGDIAFQSLPAQFRRKGAAIVVSTIAELLDVHAPRLAAFILGELAKPAASQRTFGEIMLTVKRTCVAQGLPIAMALLSYGDADWWM